MYRDPADIVAQWDGVTDRVGLEWSASGEWWQTLAATGKSLVITREYEHFVLHVSALPTPRLSYVRLPHPSGVAYSRARGRLYIASTRNPNQLYEFGPVAPDVARRDTKVRPGADVVLVPERTWYLPGATYIHDIAFIGDSLHANAVGENCVIGLDGGRATRVWWPRSVEKDGALIADRNVIQLNSIAAGPSLEASYFTASSDRPGRYRPGDAKYPVDRRGVLFSAATRDVAARGLTRPHSARFWKDIVLVCNSGYGELVACRGASVDVVAKLPGWTRGLGIVGDIAFVGTSRVIPRFAQYAPGLSVETAVCGVSAVDLRTGRTLGTLSFPNGNQIFAVEAIPQSLATGFPFDTAARNLDAERRLFYAYHRVAGDAEPSEGIQESPRELRGR
jgi:uncharacterized protein (TIGR03032 family)